MSALFHFAKESLNDIARANKLPRFFWELVESQTGVQIPLETIDGGGIDPFVFGDKSCHDLLGFCAVRLVKDRFEFGIDLFMLLLRDVAQGVLHFVLHAALVFGRGELVLDGIDHRLATIGDT